MDNNRIIMKNGFGIAHINVCSIKNKFDLLKLKCADENFHVLTISETWLTQLDEDTMFNIPDYNLIRLDRDWGHVNGIPKSGGGLCMFIKNGVDFSDTKLQHLNLSSNNIEIQIIYITNKLCKDLIVINIYRPPTANIYEFIRTLENTIKLCNPNDKHDVFVLGDFNVDMMSRNTNRNAMEYRLQSMGYKQLINEVTRYSTTKCRDLIFTNSNLI